MEIRFEFDHDSQTVLPIYRPSSSSDDGKVDLPRKTYKEFLEIMEPDSSDRIGILPPAVRWVSSDMRQAIFERPPAEYFLDVAWASKFDAETATHKSWTVPVPWTVYLVIFDEYFTPIGISVLGRRGPLESIETDTGFLLPLFNLYADSKLCMPTVGGFEDHPETLAWGVQEAFNMVWNSGFNLDLTVALDSYLGSHKPWRLPEMIAGGDTLESFITRWSEKSIREALGGNYLFPTIEEAGPLALDPGGGDTTKGPGGKKISIAQRMKNAAGHMGVGDGGHIAHLLNAFSI